MPKFRVHLYVEVEAENADAAGDQVYEIFTDYVPRAMYSKYQEESIYHMNEENEHLGGN